MANLSKENRLRNEGLDMALRIACEHGIEGLAAEVKRRGAMGAANYIPDSVLQKASEEMLERSSILAVAISVYIMKNRFYFNEAQLDDFKIAFSNLIELCSKDKELSDSIIEKSDITFE